MEVWERIVAWVVQGAPQMAFSLKEVVLEVLALTTLV